MSALPKKDILFLNKVSMTNPTPPFRRPNTDTEKRGDLHVELFKEKKVVSRYGGKEKVSKEVIKTRKKETVKMKKRWGKEMVVHHECKGNRQRGSRVVVESPSHMCGVCQTLLHTEMKPGKLFSEFKTHFFFQYFFLSYLS